MNVMLFGPELYYLGTALVFFLLSLRRQVQVKADYQIALALAAGGLVVTALSLCQQGELFFKAYRVDLFSQIFKFALALGFFLVLTISHNLAHIEERYHAEFYLFLTTTTIGMMMLVSSVELLTIYVSLELSSYSLYILVPLRRGDGIDVEAGIKYLLIGAVSSGVMLFGLSYIFGATHSTYLVGYHGASCPNWRPAPSASWVCSWPWRASSLSSPCSPSTSGRRMSTRARPTR